MSGTGKGFTLVEILVSVAILSIGAVLVMQALGRAASAMVIAEHRHQATLFSVSKMAEVEMSLLQGQELEEHTAGSFQIDEQLYQWSLSSPLNKEDPQRKSVSLVVTWNDGRQTSGHHVETVLRQRKAKNDSKAS